jgi:hypothetical protein
MTKPGKDADGLGQNRGTTYAGRNVDDPDRPQIERTRAALKANGRRLLCGPPTKVILPY